MKFNYLSPPYFLVVVILILIIITAATATTVVDVHAEAEVEDYDDEAVEADDDNDAAEAEVEDYDDDADWLMNNNISLIIHRNGEIDPCGVTGSITKNNFIQNLLPSKLNKYEIESRLTDNIFKTIITTTNDNDNDNDGDKKNNIDLCGPGSSNGSSNSNINDDDDDDDDDEYDDDDDSHTDDSLFEGIDDDDDSYKNKEEEDEKVVVNAAKAKSKSKKKSSSLSTFSSSSFYKHCDRGPEYTPILLDHNKLVKTSKDSLPCRFYTREGLRITSLKQLTNLIITEQQSKELQQSCNATANPQDGSSSSSSSSECNNNNNNNNNDDEHSDNNTNNTNTFQFHLYAVPAGRVFIFAPSHVDEIFELNHMKLLPNINKPISLKVLSVNPKIFDIINVFTKDEALAVVQRALEEKSPSHKIKRSTTGSGVNSIIQKRTSENAFDTHSKVALDLKKRIFELLGFDEYWNGHDDGLQVLRYK
jgi:hypothetical protein